MTTQAYQQASQRFLGPSQAGTGRRRPAAGHPRRDGAPPPKSSRPSPNSAAGNTAGTDTTSSPSAVSGLRPETETYAACSTQPVALHENFYENTMSAEDIAESLDDVQALLERLETLLEQV